MANRTNEENWAAQERLRAIERAVWWRGWIRRGDLVEIFGISRAQASSDLQKYQQLNPGALVYQMSRKRYEGAVEMNCVLHTPQLEGGMAAFLGGALSSGISLTSDGEASESVTRVTLPGRKGLPVIERQMLMAVASGQKIEVRYWSVNSGKASWRCLAPHAFGHDGYRWHVRAWCYERADYRDFVLSRIEKAKWPEVKDDEQPADSDWTTMVEVRVRANQELREAAQRAIELDYGIKKGGVLKLDVRKSMKGYLLDHLRIGREGGKLPQHFECC